MQRVKMAEFMFTTKQDRDYAIEVFIFKHSINDEEVKNDTSYSLKGEEVVISWSETPPHLCRYLEDCRRYY